MTIYKVGPPPENQSSGNHGFPLFIQLLGVFEQLVSDIRDHTTLTTGLRGTLEAGECDHILNIVNGYIYLKFLGKCQVESSAILHMIEEKYIH